MRNKLLLKTLKGSALAVCLFNLTTTASAVEFEAGVTVEKQPGFDDPGYGFGLKYYFTPVAFGSGVPRDEIAFVERVATLKADASWQKSSSRQSETFEDPPFRHMADFDIDLSTSDINAEYVYREAGVPHVFTLQGGLIKSEIDIDAVFRTYLNNALYSEDSDSMSESFDGYGVEIGYDYYLADHWTVGGSVSRVSIDTPDGDQDLTNVGIRTERLWQLQGGDWVGLAAGVDYIWQDSENTWGWNVGAKYYWNERTGIYGEASGDSEGEGTAFEAGISHYFSDVVFVRVYGMNIEHETESPWGNDSKTGWGLTIGASY